MQHSIFNPWRLSNPPAALRDPLVKCHNDGDRCWVIGLRSSVLGAGWLGCEYRAIRRSVHEEPSGEGVSVLSVSGRGRGRGLPASIKYEWLLPAPLPASYGERFPRACRPLLQALYTRGILDEAGDRLRAFFDVADPGPDPFLLKDMDRAVERILFEVQSGRPIGVFGHYDCDGVTATVLLSQTLTALGARVVPFIPSRSDTYGIPINGIESLAVSGVSLIVTVDCGIKASPEVEWAAARGIEIIITDHHLCERSIDVDSRLLQCNIGVTVGKGATADALPPAYAVVNPKRADCPYPFKSLAGVGLAFRLSQALARASGYDRVSAEEIDSMLDLVCLGTVADVVDLTGENRCLVARGLTKIQSLARPGIRSLAGAASLAPGRITAKDVAFVLAPRINAAARLEHGVLSHDLLCAPSCEAAAPLAARLEALNRERRRLTVEAVDYACLTLEESMDGQLILAAVGGWLTGISGLVASQIRERYGRPALAISTRAFSDVTSESAAAISLCTARSPAALSDGAVPANTICIGSARSIPGFDITAALGAAHEHLEGYGGHAGAAGFSVRYGAIPALEESLNRYASTTLSPDDIAPRLAVDASLTPDELTAEFAAQLERFEPCGSGNAAPTFLIRGACILPGSTRVYGLDDKSSRGDRFSYRIQGPCGPIRVTAQGVEMLRSAVHGSPLDLVCHALPDHRSAARIKLAALDARAAGDSSDAPTSQSETAPAVRKG